MSWHKNRVLKMLSRDSSVGRASDWRSEGPWFNPGSRHFRKSNTNSIWALVEHHKLIGASCYTARSSKSTILILIKSPLIFWKNPTEILKKYPQIRSQNPYFNIEPLIYTQDHDLDFSLTLFQKIPLKPTYHFNTIATLYKDQDLNPNPPKHPHAHLTTTIKPL